MWLPLLILALLVLYVVSDYRFSLLMGSTHSAAASILLIIAKVVRRAMARPLTNFFFHTEGEGTKMKGHSYAQDRMFSKLLCAPSNAACDPARCLPPLFVAVSSFLYFSPLVSIKFENMQLAANDCTRKHYACFHTDKSTTHARLRWIVPLIVYQIAPNIRFWWFKTQ